MRMERVLVTAADIIHVAAEHTNTYNKTLLVTRNKHSKKNKVGIARIYDTMRHFRLITVAVEKQ